MCGRFVLFSYISYVFRRSIADMMLQALIRALNSHRLYASIKQCTTGLMFFGVPHHGGNGVRVGKVLIQQIDTFVGSELTLK